MIGFDILAAFLGGILIFAIIAAIIGSFLFDSLVLLISSFALKIDNKSSFFWKHIFGVWICGGVVSIGTALLLNLTPIGNLTFLSYFLDAIVSAGLTFFCNYYFVFKNDDEKIRKVMSIIFTIIAGLSALG